MNRGRLQKTACALILSALCFGLGGCALVEEAQKLVPETELVVEETTLVVQPDGTWTETIIDGLDQAYYDAGELKALVDETVSAHNAEQKDQVVTVEDFTTDEKGISLRMRYPDAQAYASYNHVPAFQGSMLEAQMAGFLFLNEFRKVADGVSAAETIPNGEPLSHKEYQVLVTDLTHVVRMPAKVKYVSANASVAEGKIVRPEASGTDSKEPEGLVLPSSAVYAGKGSSRQISEAEQEEAYLYIIYE